ncbi:MAG: hypothetical protein J6B29_00175 [Clostridia bacterium]|nr:hypothetical protein [Clostridia bacterium]
MLLATGLIALLVSVLIYVALMTMVLPKRMIKVKYTINECEDRGVKKCLFKDRNCIVYKSSNTNKKYIKQYVLVQQDGYKLLKCKLSSMVEYIDYDIVLFDRCNKPFRVINVKEDILGVDYTRSTILPNETSYITIVIRKVNKQSFKVSPIVKLKGGSVLGFSIITVLLTALEGFIVRACCSYSFGGVFRESFIASANGILFVLGLALVAGLLSAILVNISASRRARH